MSRNAWKGNLKFKPASEYCACPYGLQRYIVRLYSIVCGVRKRVDGTRFNDRLVCDLKKFLIRIPFLDGVFGNKDEKGGKIMKKFCRKVKVFFKSGIKRVVAFCRQNKKSIVRLVGKFVIYVCKTIIELFFDNLF